MGSVKCYRSMNELSKFQAKHNNNLANIKREEAVRMKKAKVVTSSESSRKMRPALSPEARENQLVSLAVDLAEKQLRDGTASSQVITHYLKLGSTKERIEKEILEKQKELIEAKTQSLQSAQRIEELYKNALDAMRNYSGQGDPDDY
jgi:EAL domain-containing protein (putative c-di-GMP-specific phosphodiesterase class I)